MKRKLKMLRVSVFLLMGCGKSDKTVKEDNQNQEAGEKTVIKLGSSGINTNMIDIISELMPENYDVQLVTFDSNAGGAETCASGDIDGFIYNHEPWLKQYNKDNGTDYVVVDKLYYGRSALYSNKYDKLEDLPDGCSIAICNDSVNMENNLLFLEELGLIKMGEKDSEDSFLTTIDVIENPKNIKFVEVEISYAVGSLDEVDAAIVSSTNVLEAGLDPEKFLAENVSKKNYPIGLTVVKENEKTQWVADVLEVLHSEEFKKRFNEIYKGSLVLF